VATNATCTEINATSFRCTCPGGGSIVVTVGETFKGTCNGTLTPEQIVAHINFAHLEAFLVNGVFQITGVIEVGIDGSSFTIDVNTTSPVNNFQAILAQQIAAFLGGGFTAGDITVDVTSAPTSQKRGSTVPQSHTVSITIGGHVSSAPSFVVSFYILAALVLFFSI
jgi:hypothetical protein